MHRDNPNNLIVVASMQQARCSSIVAALWLHRTNLFVLAASRHHSRCSCIKVLVASREDSCCGCSNEPLLCGFIGAKISLLLHRANPIRCGCMNTTISLSLHPGKSLFQLHRVYNLVVVASSQPLRFDFIEEIISE